MNHVVRLFAMTQDKRWKARYEEVKAFIETNSKLSILTFCV